MAQELALSKTKGSLYLILLSMRSRQWLKNGFLFAALLFSRNIFHWYHGGDKLPRPARILRRHWESRSPLIEYE